MFPVKKLALIIAMPKEVAPLRTLITQEQVWQHRFIKASMGRLNSTELLIAQSGIGKVAAAVATSEVLQSFQPDVLLNVGVSGGLGANLQQGDIVLADRVCYHDVSCGKDVPWGQVQGFPLYYPMDSMLIAHLEQKNSALHKGLITCGDRFLSDPNEYQFIRSSFPETLAIDMESAAIAQTCYLYGQPMGIVRIISDTPGRGDSYQQYKDFWQRKELCQPSFEQIRQLIQSLTI